MKVFISALLTCIAVTCLAQKSFKATGYFQRQKVSVVNQGLLHKADGKLYYAEQRSKKAISMGGRILAISVVDQKTLKRSKTKVYEDVATYLSTKERYKAMKLYKSSNSFLLLAFDRETASFVTMTIDMKTLQLSPKVNVVQSVEKELDIKAKKLIKELEKGAFKCDALLLENSASDGCSIITFINEYEKGGIGKGYLFKSSTTTRFSIDQSGQITDQQVIDIDKLSKENNTLSPLLYLDENDNLVMLATTDPEKTSEPGFVFAVLSNKGEVIKKKKIQISGPFPKLESGWYPWQVVKKITDKHIYIAGYDAKRQGCVVGKISMSVDKSDDFLVYTPFTPELVAESRVKNLKKLEKKKTAKNSASITDLNPSNLTVTDDGEILFTGLIQDYKWISTGDNSILEYQYKGILVSKATSNGRIEFSKLIKVDESSTQSSTTSLYAPRPYMVNGKIRLFVNRYSKDIEGTNLKGLPPTGNSTGALISIDPDGGEWKMEPYNFSGSLSKCCVISSSGVELSRGVWVFGAAPFGIRNLGFVKFDFN